MTAYDQKLIKNDLREIGDMFQVLSNMDFTNPRHRQIIIENLSIISKKIVNLSADIAVELYITRENDYTGN